MNLQILLGFAILFSVVLIGLYLITNRICECIEKKNNISETSKAYLKMIELDKNVPKQLEWTDFIDKYKKK